MRRLTLPLLLSALILLSATILSSARLSAEQSLAGEGGKGKSGGSSSVKFPEFLLPLPTPKTDLTTVPILRKDVLYVIVAEKDPILVIDSPEGLVTIKKKTGAVTIFAKFIDGSGEIEEREYSGKEVYLITPTKLTKGRLYLNIVPLGTTKTSDIIRKVVDVDTGVVPPNPPDPPIPPPDPPIPPKPPDPPVPPKPPDPIPSNPIPLPGFRVMILYESKSVVPLGPARAAILKSAPVRSYLASKCAADPTSLDDGKAYKIWDVDVLKDIDGVPKFESWATAMKRKRDSLPWLVISNGDTKTGFEGPLPANSADTISLLRKYAEPAKEVK